MKGTIKRFTSLMLALLMTLALLPMEVLAAENVSDFTQLTELTSEAQIASTPAIQPLADAATAVPATFSVGSQTYSDLNDAITAAQSGTDKTIVVAAKFKEKHPIYGKFVSKTKKYHAHDEKNDCHVGDTVLIMETRPLSKTKTWRVVEIVERAK